MKEEPFVIERTFNVDVQKVWEAITDKEQMKHWYFDLAEFKPEVGFKFSFIGGTEEEQFVHLCQVTEVIPQKKLAYSWDYQGYVGSSLVTFELYNEGASTKLKLTHSGLETFPSDNPNLKQENFAEGWTYIIGTSLNNYLNNSSTNG
ncbi:SRPBCC domain-containing protein [Solitalea sp. MAHUQ-68]|uniref:SRPBCC domain-containing protein n=1 Tax=Solitalea agri TaxID=2953739 RepID=A0A9X2FA45_9SPHI|nr:SRPBCC domain-containing protein [Solitalea agri]MCO4293188.1 SRPBCC domain-containing protein [Solitalea agri]